MTEPSNDFTSILANIITFAFISICLFYFIKGFIKPDPSKIPAWLSDLLDGKIQLGYIDDAEEQVDIQVEAATKDTVTHLREQVEILKLKKQLKELKEETAKPTVDSKLLKECADVLVSLGEKRADAKRKAKEFLQDNPNASVNDFISKVYQK